MSLGHMTPQILAAKNKKKLRLGRYKLKVVKPYEEIIFNYVIMHKTSETNV